MKTKMNVIKNIELGGLALLAAIALVGVATSAKAANPLSQTQNRQTLENIENVIPEQNRLKESRSKFSWVGLPEMTQEDAFGNTLDTQDNFPKPPNGAYYLAIRG